VTAIFGVEMVKLVGQYRRASPGSDAQAGKLRVHSRAGRGDEPDTYFLRDSIRRAEEP